MSKLVKNMITEELRSRYGEVDSALWLEIVGVDGVTTNEFRRELHGKEMRLEVVKNSLFRNAVGDGPLKPLAEALTGPAAIITGGESLIDVGKLVEEWLPKAAKGKGIKMRGAVLDGEWLDEKMVAGLAKMETKQDLQAKIAMIVLSPGGNIASAINSGGGNIAGAIEALIEKLEKGEEIPKKTA